MNRSEFARNHGATCVNERFAWSYINEDQAFVIFGAWKHHTANGLQLILSKSWERNAEGKKNKGYGPSIRHVDRILEERFKLFTFPMTAVEGTEDGPTKIDSFISELTERRLLVNGDDYYAALVDSTAVAVSKLPQDYWEGARREIVQTSYERNPDARRRCLMEFGFSCRVCGLNFEEKYGGLGKGYIHVHHLILVSERKTSYKVDPIKDMRPVCPNCHAMIHKRYPPYSIEEMRGIIAEKDHVAGGKK